ncbi:MAG: hypothetical protein AB2L14_29240 [Candidatus Xenobiia bacterium LiM19]
MKRVIFLLTLTVLMLSLAASAYAQCLINVKVVPSTKDAKGKTLICHITGDTQGKAAWLGCSFYPARYSDRLRDGYHEIYQVSNSFQKNWELPERFYEGSFEIALWGDKVMKNKCNKVDCFLCNKFGYHLENTLDFCSGTILATTTTGFRINIAENGDKLTITVTGVAGNGSAYLGASFYPKECKDIFDDAQHDCRLVQKTFLESWTVPKRYKDGRYDIALWNKKISKNACTLKSCIWCEKLGYHLWWVLFLKSGKIDIRQEF